MVALIFMAETAVFYLPDLAITIRALRSQETRSKALPTGFYTPIATEQGQAAQVRPVYYGMLLTQEFADATMLASETPLTEMLGVYAAEKNRKMVVALVNKAASVHREITLTTGRSCNNASLWRLTAPALDASTDIELGKAVVGRNGMWNPRSEYLPGGCK